MPNHAKPGSVPAHYEIFAPNAPGESMVSTGNSADTLDDAQIEASEMFGDDTSFRNVGGLVWDGIDPDGQIVCRIRGAS